jgi:hypothetical protein
MDTSRRQMKRRHKLFLLASSYLLACEEGAMTLNYNKGRTAFHGED